jgi:autotransporter-associated beta strand protein
MMKTSGLMRVALAVVVGLLAISGPTAMAATYYWNTTTTGTWATGANWSNNPISGGTTGTAPGSTDTAFFNQSSINGNATIQLSSGQSVASIVFVNTGATTIQSDSGTARTLTVGGITINSGSGAVTIGDATNTTNVTMATGAQSWLNNSGNTLTFANNVTKASNLLTIGGSGNTTISGNLTSGNSGLTKTGSGTVTLQGSANTYTGTNTVTAGTLNLQGTFTGATFGLTASGGVLNLTGSVASTSTLTFGGGVFQVGGSGTQTIASTANLTASTSGRIIVGASKTLAVTGGVPSVGANSAATFNIAASGAVLNFVGGTASANLTSSIAVLDSTGYGFGALDGSKNVIRRTVTTMPTDQGSFSSSADYQADGSTNITITGTGTAAANAIAVDTFAGSGSLTLSSGITLNANIFHFGGNASNTYSISGGTGIKGGTNANGHLIINNNGGTLTINSTILANGSGHQSFYGGGTVILNGGSTVSNGTATNANTFISGNTRLQVASASQFNSGSYVNNISIGGGSTLQWSSSANQTLSGNITGAGSLIKDTSTSTLTISGNNTYTGSTSVNSGTLDLGTAGTISNTSSISIGNGATLSFGVNVLNLADGATVTGTGTTGFLTSTGTNTSNLRMNGNNIMSSVGTLTLSRLDVNGAGNQITGGSIQSGASGTRRGLVVGNAAAGTLTIPGGTFTSVGGSAADLVGAAVDGNGTLVVNGGSYVNTAGNGTLSLGQVGVSGNTTGVLTLASGSATIHTLEFSPTGTLGSATVNLNGGTLTVSNITANATANSKAVNFNGGQFVAGANIPAFSGLTMNVQNGGANINTNGFSFAISDPLLNAGSGGLVKTGNGTLTLSGNSTYTGATSITGGTLAVTGTGAINGTSGITLNGGKLQYTSSVALSKPLTFTSGTLGGTNWNGSLGNLTIGAGQTISPGNSPGTAFTDNQTWTTGGNYTWEINDALGSAGNATAGWDLLSGNGTLDITATSGSPFTIRITSLNLSNVAGPAANFDSTLSYNWLIADFLNPVTGFDVTKFSLDLTGFLNTYNGTFSVARGDTVSGGDNTQVYVSYVAVPEPAAIALAACGVLGLGIAARRRFRQAQTL